MYKKTLTQKIFTTVFALFVMAPFELYAVAYCALRDPVFAMQAFYPDFSSFRSFPGVVGPELYDELNEHLPYETHFNEFGKHTLYVAYDGDQALGIVHARTEKGDWGLDELVWSFNVDMTVQDFRFQRSRSKWKAEIESPEFKALLQGKGFHELKALLSMDGMNFVDGSARLTKGAEGLAAIAVRSALKTMIVTEYVWGQELKDLGIVVEGTGVQ